MDDAELVAAIDEARRFARLLYYGHRTGIWDYAAYGVPETWSEWPVWLTGRQPGGVQFEITPAPVAVAVEHDYVLSITFEDGLVGLVNMARHLWGPAFEPLKDPAFFARAHIANGTVTWPNGADWAPEELYRVARENPVAD